MGDASLGETVQVRNTRSRKIVEGTVTGPGIVSLQY
jgi:flagella basal body P-ring formation protein FlgA